MAIKIVKISELYDKDLFAGKNQVINIRSGAGTYSAILRKISAGGKIGKVATHAEGRNDKKEKDGSIWLQLVEKYSNPSGYGAWVKFMPNAFDWKALQEQGAQTVEEEKKEEEEKNKDWKDKLSDSFKSLLPWIAIVYLAGKKIDSKK